MRESFKNYLHARLLKLLRSVSIRHGVIMSVAMILAGALDYGVNILAGRWLQPVGYGVFISVAAILQVLVYLAIAIRNVAAYYTADLSAKTDSTSQLTAFVQRAWRWSWRWGLAATALTFLVSPLLTRILRLSSPWPLWAAVPAVLLLFVRAVTDGSLQGMQAFTGFGLVQVTQSLLRLLFAAGLIWLGLEAAGAILALPLAMSFALVLALWFLRPCFLNTIQGSSKPVSWHYSSYTLLGLAAFALLVNLDALFVKHFFTPRVAGDYGPVVTLAKVSLFTPLAMGIILLPKAAQRQASGRDPRPILLMALAGAVVPGLVLTTLYFLFPGWLVKAIFTGAYANPGIILGLASLAASLYAGLNIWLNYALALERPMFIYALGGVLVWQALGMLLLGRDNLVHMTLVMISAGVVGNIAGAATTWHIAARTESIHARIVEA